MKLSALLFGAAAAQLPTFPPTGQVHLHIGDENCKENYIRNREPACIRDGQCFPHGTSAENHCEDIELWQWQNPGHSDPHRRFHAPGVNPSPIHRVTGNGSMAEKIVWAYAGEVQEGEAQQIYNPKGASTVAQVLNTPVNHITFIANINVEKPSQWFVPGQNNTDGCGQRQTDGLPFGYGNTTEEKTEFKKNLATLHKSGVTITLTLASWCTQLPVKVEEEWGPEQFEEFVDYFLELKEEHFGGHLDGVDFDWEGFCSKECLKGHNDCQCGWDSTACGNKSPEELAKGVTYKTQDNRQFQCWVLPTKSTIQVMTGITKHMKDSGHVVTLVPMSTSLYSGEEDKTEKQVMRNEYSKYRKQPYDGGKQITRDGGKVDLLEMADSVLLQWYSGFDASLCENSDDPNRCKCDNIPSDDYPNVLNASNGLISAYYDTAKGGGNMFPSTFPVRCQACGKNVTLPNGTYGEFPCAPKGEDWFVPGNTTEDVKNHNTELVKFSKEHNNSVPHWWVKDHTIPSACPRGIDCPDWRYKDEKPYARQLKLLTSISKVMDVSKVAIGFETLGIDVMVQMESWADKALPWDTVNHLKDKEHRYHAACTKNLTQADVEKGALSKTGALQRCAQPLLSQQWGLKFNATEMVGLDKAVKDATGKGLAGVGVYTLDGILATDPSLKANKTDIATWPRLWFDELVKLNKTYQIPMQCGSQCFANKK
jgi:hypothetical protein